MSDVEESHITREQYKELLLQSRRDRSAKMEIERDLKRLQVERRQRERSVWCAVLLVFVAYLVLIYGAV